MTFFIPQPIHKDNPIAPKLNRLDFDSLLGKWHWELRGNWYHPVLKGRIDDEHMEIITNAIHTKDATTRGFQWWKLIPFVVAAGAGFAAWLG